MNPSVDHERNKLRSENWFNDTDDAGMTAIYMERYLNYGLTREELQSGSPIIGIAQIGSDLTPCNRGHLETVKGLVAADAKGLVLDFTFCRTE